MYNNIYIYIYIYMTEQASQERYAKYTLLRQNLLHHELALAPEISLKWEIENCHPCCSPRLLS